MGIKRQVILVFDLDGTLIDRNKSLEIFAKEIYNYFVINYSISSTKDYFVNKLIKLDADGSINKKILYNTLADEFKVTNFEFSSFFSYYQDNFYKYNILYDKSIEALDFFTKNDFELSLITNGSETQIKKISLLKIENYFKYKIVSDLVGIAKPDPKIFRIFIDKYNNPELTYIYIGDDKNKDIIASMKVGFKSVWISNNSEWDKNEKPNLIISNILEYKKIYDFCLKFDQEIQIFY